MTYYLPKYSLNYLVHEVEQRIKKYKLKNVNISGEPGINMHYFIGLGKPKDKHQWKFFIYIKDKNILLSEITPGQKFGTLNILIFYDDKRLIDLELWFKKIKLIREITEKI